MCDWFLDTACYCVEVDDNFVNFQRKCLKKTKSSEIFGICDWTGRQLQFLPIKFFVCCKALADFQIDSFV